MSIIDSAVENGYSIEDESAELFSCPACDGRGHFQITLEYESPCGYCNGTGKVIRNTDRKTGGSDE